MISPCESYNQVCHTPFAIQHLRFPSATLAGRGVVSSNTAMKKLERYGDLLKNPIAFKMYGCWAEMRRRCSNPKHRSYKDYGGRGIKVCKRWDKSFMSFFKDVGLRPIGFSLDRINNNGNYTKSNCRWATQFQQSNNARRVRMISYKGKTMSISSWETLYGVNHGAFYYRIVLAGWPIEKSFNYPMRKRIRS